MTSMGDIGRELNEIRNHPTPSKPQNELDRLEARLKAFFEWAHGRPHPEIRDKFAEDFSDAPLHDEVVDALKQGKGEEIRDQLPVEPEPGATS